MINELEYKICCREWKKKSTANNNESMKHNDYIKSFPFFIYESLNFLFMNKRFHFRTLASLPWQWIPIDSLGRIELLPISVTMNVQFLTLMTLDFGDEIRSFWFFFIECCLWCSVQSHPRDIFFDYLRNFMGNYERNNLQL